ncbi:hypothetical protein [Actinokineospora globicatena]|uniref:Uncharacterized protein n=1 Tax=Actinokineospora globicatena TaxID=103729 RepID=A0A9W6QIL3_9PSEU|nr:hypothetical protein [Actinokineospora globicatena]GLW90147.1 hypothetical protein Aglo03_09630 [Actinokineospora globicatena]
MGSEIRECALTGCDSRFTPRSNRQRYCTPEHAAEGRALRRTAEDLGIEDYLGALRQLGHDTLTALQPRAAEITAAATELTTTLATVVAGFTELDTAATARVADAEARAQRAEAETAEAKDLAARMVVERDAALAKAIEAERVTGEAIGDRHAAESESVAARRDLAAAVEARRLESARADRADAAAAQDRARAESADDRATRLAARVRSLTAERRDLWHRLTTETTRADTAERDTTRVRDQARHDLDQSHAQADALRAQLTTAQATAARVESLQAELATVGAAHAQAQTALTEAQRHADTQLQSLHREHAQALERHITTAITATTSHDALRQHLRSELTHLLAHPDPTTLPARIQRLQEALTPPPAPTSP